jgi:hypothetical protein
MNRVNIVCLKWGSKYPSDYVNRLYGMVQRTLTLPHRFVCVTDDRSGLHPAIEVRPIENEDLSGWWHKVALFKPRFYDLAGTALFLDLDTVIIEGLDNFFLLPGDVCMITDWSPSHHNSAIFRLELGSHPEVWERFAADHRRLTSRLKGDQDWFTETLPEAVGWPPGWIKSYKQHLVPASSETTASLPPGTLIVAFHGRPHPHEVKDAACGEWKHAPWINEFWK